MNERNFMRVFGWVVGFLYELIDRFGDASP